MICWMNGQFMEEQNVTISPFDHGFLYGLGFFETFRTVTGQVPFIKEHYERLSNALKVYRIQMPFTLEQLRGIVTELVQQNGGEDGYFRVNVSAGEQAIGLAPDHYDRPNAIVFQKQLLLSTPHVEKSARWLSIRRNSPEGPFRTKGHAYGNNVLARFELPNLATEEGFFLTESGYVAEGITSNIFWVNNGTLYTPSVEAGILNGVTRQIVLRLAQKENIVVNEGLFTKESVEQAQEVFVTTAIQGLVPISSLDGVSRIGASGNIYCTLHTAYMNEIEYRLKGES